MLLIVLIVLIVLMVVGGIINLSFIGFGCVVGCWLGANFPGREKSIHVATRSEIDGLRPST